MRALVITVSLLAGCVGPTVFECEVDQQCGAGRCQPATHLCSFADDDCPSGQRYGELAGDAYAGSCAAVDPAAPPWWDDRFTVRERVTVENRSTKTLESDHEVAIDVDLEVRPGLRVVRWDDDDGWLEQPLVIEPRTGRIERVWTAIGAPLAPGESAGALWLHRGEDVARGPDEPERVFAFHADFDDPTAVAIGGPPETDPQPSVGGGVLTVPGNSIGYPQVVFPVDHAVDVAIRITGWTGNRFVGWYALAPDGRRVFITWAAAENQTVMPFFLHDGGPAYYGAPIGLDLTTHVWTAERSATASRYLLDGEPVEERSLGETVELDMYALVANEAAEAVVIDWIRVRRAALPAPLVTVGEEDQP